MTKNMIRRQMIARRKTISPSEKQRLDQAIHNNLLDRPEWRRAKTICIYVSLLQEVDTRSLISTSLQQQKSIIVPEKRHEETHITDVDLFIVPGIAFDPKGYRLGWGKGYYDRFRGRLMFPIADSSGRIIAFSGRILVDDGKSAKYLNSPDTVLFNKSNVLYGIDKAKQDIRIKNYSILVEGQMDLVLSHQVGIKNTVAVSGTALADTLISKENIVNNLGIVKRLSNNIILAFDSDNEKKRHRGSRYFENIIHLP